MQRFTASLAVVYAASAIALSACSANESNNNGGSGGAKASGGASTSQGGSAQGGATNSQGGTTASGGAASGGASSGGANTSGGAASGGATSGGASSGGANTSGGATSGGSGGAAGANGGTAGANGGTGGGGSVELKMPIARNGKYVLEFGDILFEVDPMVGGRIVTFSLGGKNVLLLKSENTTQDNNYGSILWPSPQSTWSWPPIPAFDSDAPVASVDGNTIVLTQSTPSKPANLTYVKRFTPVLDAQAIDLEYTITNKGTTAATWANWEITRVHQEGLTFFPFPSGAKVIPISGSTPVLKTQLVMNQGGISWYKNSKSDEVGKYNADCAEGWLAQVSSDLLFVKRFADVPEAQLAASEADCEFFAGASYEEIEVQSPAKNLAVNDSVTLKVRWYLRKLSDTSIATVGNAQLATMVRDLIKQ